MLLKKSRDSPLSLGTQPIDIDGSKNKLRNEGEQGLAHTKGLGPLGPGTGGGNPAGSSSRSRDWFRMHCLVNCLTPLSTCLGGSALGLDKLKQESQLCYGKGYRSYQGLNRVWGPGSVYTRADSRLIELEEENYKQYPKGGNYLKQGYRISWAGCGERGRTHGSLK